MKVKYKINKRTVIEYLLTAIFFYMIKIYAFKYFEEIKEILIKIGLIIGSVLLLVALLMILIEVKTKNEFITGDPVFQYKIESNEEYEEIKRNAPSLYWYSRANLERQYAIVSVGVVAGLGVSTAAWNHVAFILLYIVILIIGCFVKNSFEKK